MTTTLESLEGNWRITVSNAEVKINRGAYTYVLKDDERKGTVSHFLRGFSFIPLRPFQKNAEVTKENPFSCIWMNGEDVSVNFKILPGTVKGK